MDNLNGGFYLLMAYCFLVYALYNVALVKLKKKQMEVLGRWIQAAEELRDAKRFREAVNKRGKGLL